MPYFSVEKLSNFLWQNIVFSLSRLVIVIHRMNIYVKRRVKKQAHGVCLLIFLNISQPECIHQFSCNFNLALKIKFYLATDCYGMRQFYNIKLTVIFFIFFHSFNGKIIYFKPGWGRANNVVCVCLSVRLSNFLNVCPARMPREIFF